MDEEARGLLRKIVEGQGYRQLMLANIRSHGLKFIPYIEGKLALADDLNHSLRQVREVDRLYGQVSDDNLLLRVRDRMDRIPYPQSRLELAVCLFLCERVERAALLAYTDSAYRDLAAVSITRLESMPVEDLPSDPIFVEYCADRGNAVHAQQLFNRWLKLTLIALGRPSSRGDERAVALGLRSRPVVKIVADYLAGLAPFLAKTGLYLPDGATLGLELPSVARETSRTQER